MFQAHAAQHVRCFGELNILIINNLNAVSPWIAEVKERPFEQHNACLSKSMTSSLLIIDDKTEMTTVVGRLLASLLKGNELIAEVDEGHSVTSAAQLEFERRP